MLKTLIFVLALVALANCDGRLIYRFYFGPASNDFAEYDFINFHTVLNHPQFVRTRGTVLFLHGEGQSLVTSQVADIVSAYQARATFNLIVIRFADAATINTDNANALAAGISSNLVTLFDNGYSSGLMNLIGFGIGAQILARSSRQVQSSTSRRHIIGRLTGLDPWSLGPINAITIGRLSSADAQWVESIHTEGNQRGDLESNGHVSFFVNGGIAQPFCNQPLPQTRWDCSHVFALTIWAESVRSINPTFPALSCATWESFLSGACNSNSVAFMGRTSEATFRGPHQLMTNMQAPWSRNNALP